MSDIFLCSACLLGLNCRYNNGNKKNNKIIDFANYNVLIPVCPEQLGGASTPREPANQQGIKVITKSGVDITNIFEIGAIEILKISALYNITKIILYSNGCEKIKILKELFKNNDLKIISSEKF